MSDLTVKGIARGRITRNRRYRNTFVPAPGVAAAIAANPELFTLRPGRAFNEARSLERMSTTPYLPTAVDASESERAPIRPSVRSA